MDLEVKHDMINPASEARYDEPSTRVRYDEPYKWSTTRWTLQVEHDIMNQCQTLNRNFAVRATCLFGNGRVKIWKEGKKKGRKEGSCGWLDDTGGWRLGCTRTRPPSATTTLTVARTERMQWQRLQFSAKNYTSATAYASAAVTFVVEYRVFGTFQGGIAEVQRD